MLIEGAEPEPYLAGQHAAMILKFARLGRPGLLSEHLGSSGQELIADPDQLLPALSSTIQ